MKNGTMALAMAASIFGACGCSAAEQETVKAAAEPAGEAVVETDVDEEPLRIAVTRI